MLYITTRDNRDAFTAYRALNSDCAPDGGRFVPFRMPLYEKEEIAALKEKPFNQIIAEILNMFFSSRLTQWDVDFCIGRNAVRLVSMNHRIAVAELWHNPDAKLSFIIKNLYRKIHSSEALAGMPTDWVKIAVRIALIFGLYGEMLRQEITNCSQTVDISASAGDFSEPMAALYARKMGLPIGTIICTCDENSAVWDLIHRGVFQTAGADESLLLGLERLIHATLGISEAEKFRAACTKGRVYSVGEAILPVLNDGLFCAVAGKNRAESTINSVFRSNAYIIDPLTALCYGGLQDYRARTGGSSMTLLFAERTPLDFVSEISAATGISQQKLIDHVNLS